MKIQNINSFKGLINGEALTEYENPDNKNFHRVTVLNVT